MRAARQQIGYAVQVPAHVALGMFGRQARQIDRGRIAVQGPVDEVLIRGYDVVRDPIPEF